MKIVHHKMDIEVLAPQPDFELEDFSSIFNEDSKQFIFELISTFNQDVTRIFDGRKERKFLFDSTTSLPTFKQSSVRDDKSWKISPLPEKLHRRHIDIGWHSCC